MMRTRFCLLLLLLLGSITPAFAELKEVRVAPPQPAQCDPVAITAFGVLPDECYEIVSAKITGPVQVCAALICARQFFVNITVRQPNPAATCLAVNVPYNRTFRVGTLPPGDYVIGARERVIPYYLPDSTDSTVSETHASLAFTIRADSTCTGPGCYVVSFHDPTPVSSNDPDPRTRGCDEITPPGGTACIPLTLGNSVNVGGLQTTVETGTFTGGATAPFLHVVAVEPVRRASGFQVGWTQEGSRTRILLYSTSGAVIPPGDGPVLRICYRVAPNTVPGRYFVTDFETVVADRSGASIPPCPTIANFAPGIICVVPPGCDLNEDGVSDVLDIIRLVRCALATANDACPDTIAAKADCNGDGSVDIRDVICCVRKIVGAEVGTTGTSTSRATVATGTGEMNQIGFDGPIRWIDAATGVAGLRIDAVADWGGTQFSINPNVAPVRVRALRLIDGGPGVQLEWAVGPDGIARGILYASAVGPRAAWSGRVEVTFERASGPPSGEVYLGNVAAGNAAGERSNISAPSMSLPVEGSPAAPVLLRARPNPFAAHTEIAFVLPSDARAELNIYDVHGRLVRRLVQGPMSAGTNRISWDGTDGRGKAARSGIYFAKLRVGELSRTERIMLLR